VRDIESRLIELSLRARESLLGVVMSLLVAGCHFFLFQQRPIPEKG
jgi:hypothetical protein